MAKSSVQRAHVNSVVVVISNFKSRNLTKSNGNRLIVNAELFERCTKNPLEVFCRQTDRINVTIRRICQIIASFLPLWYVKICIRLRPFTCFLTGDIPRCLSLFSNLALKSIDSTDVYNVQSQPYRWSFSKAELRKVHQKFNRNWSTLPRASVVLAIIWKIFCSLLL